MRKLLIEAVEEMTPEQRNRLERNFREGYMRNEAGTDHPMYVDLTNNIVISGDYEDGDARPFAYFPVDPNEELEFFIKEYGDYSDDIQTHGDLFGEAFYQYVYNFIWRNFADKEIAFLEKMKEFGDIVKEENLKYSRWDRSFVNVDTGKNINFVDFLTNLFSELTIPVEVTSQMSHLYAEFFDEYNWETYDFIEGITDYINNSDWSYYDSSDQELIALAVGIGDLDKIYNISRFEGRIWDEGRLITFYPGQQPSRHELPGILKDICRDGGHTVDELGDFYIIFETGSKEAYTGTGYKSHKDATVKCCLIKDYLQGNYEGYDAKAEADMVKNRKGISGFCPHLANQKDKFNFFKAFRSNRDRAVFVPREKGAGTLAAYHAMRYPFGEEKKVNGNELNESSRKYNEAGTDHPFYRDKVTGKEFEANWNDGDGFPFGYWPVDSEGNKEFCVADYGETHAQACGIAARKYFYDKINDIAYDAADEICSALHDFFQGFNERGYKYNEEEGMYVSADGEDKLDIDNCIDQVMDYVYNDFPESYTVVHDFMEEFLTDGTVPSFDDVQEKLLENVDNYSFYERDDIDRALELVGTNFSDFFEEGRSQGRIWPDKEMIGFYDVAQPTPEEMEEIIYDLGEYMGEPYEYFMNFHYIYEDWDDDDYLIKMTTIDNFINSDVEKADKQYAKDGKAVFVPHLANQQDKFNFFKGFRDTRDRAVFAPREKGAGTLAAYHAMRYPYGEERDVNGNLIREEYQRSNEAGTDCPYFYDPETGFEIEGTNDDEDACPFGYFPYEVGSNDLKFFCCEDCEDVESPIHRDIVNSIIMNSINEIIDELTENDEEIIPYLRDLKNDIPSKFDFPKILTEIFEDAGVSYKPTEEFANHLYKYLGMNNWSDDVLGGWLFKDLYDEIYNYWADKDEYQIQMGYDFGVEYGDILYSGRLLGRMWPDKGLITFYPGQQPSREEMKMVITDISSRMGIEYEDLLKFYTIFEIGSKEVYTGTGYKGHDDATVQCCTIAEYIEGKYNGFNREEEVEMVKNRKGIDQLNIHLANQKDKFDYFKNFRDTRDRAVYAPREKGAGTLAGYHAMRYPFGESRKKKLLGLVNEEINKMLNEGIQLLREGNGSRAKRQTIAIIADSLGFDADSPYAIDMENRLKTIFFHHGLDCDRYIVFEPNICRCALDLGFGTNDFTGEDEKYISKVLDLIYKHIEVIENDKARQAELKRIKDSITGIDALTAIDKQLQAEFPVNNEQPVENAKEDERIVNNLANGYHREGPLTYEMAGEYGQYSNPEGRICFTYQPEQWRAYSKSDMNTCYVLLRDDWKKWNNIKPEHDGSEKNCILGEPFNKQNGYDDYGMSMIFIFVNPQGNLETANGRWNHGANWPAGYRCDHEYTEDDITKLIGQQFKNVFKSTYNFNELLAKALEKLNNGESPAKAFNYATGMYNFGGKEYCTVKLAEMYNILFDGKIVSPKWFDKITHTFNHLGLASGVIGGVNYIFDTNGKRYKFSDISQIINKKLMNGEDPGNIFFGHNFKNDKGFAVVSILGKYNILSLTANKLISNIWFDDISSTRTGLFHCSINRKNYLLLLDGKIVSEEKALTTFLYNIENYPELCRHDYDVNDETFCVEIFGNFYYVRNSDKKPINTKGFRRIEKQSNSRFVWCHNYNANPAQDEKYALDLKTGKLMLEDEFFSYIWKAAGINPDAAEEKYFEDIEPAGEGIFRIYFRGRGWNYIKDGKLMFKVWFNKCGGFENGIAKVYNNTWQWRVVNTNGEFVTPNGFLNLEIHGKYLVGYDEDDNEDYDGENDEYVEYFSVIDLSTKREIYDYARLSDSRNLSHTTLGEKFITDDDEIFLVFTKDGEMLTDDEYEALISETYERTRDLSLFDTVTDMKYGYKKVKAVYNWFNMLDKNGNLVFNEWIWMLRDFEDGRLKVEFAKHFNYLDENLRPILPNNHNYSWGDEFHCGFARVRDKDTHREYFIDVNGNIAFDKNGYEYCWEFNPNTKLARVKIDGVYYDMTTNGKLMKRD